MKKVLFLAAVLVAACTFTSCKKKCTCTEKTTGVEQKIETDSKYTTCGAIEDLLDETAAAQGASWQEWTCK